MAEPKFKQAGFHL